MGTRHIHADVIHAWAEGEEVEYQTALGFWKPTCGPPLNEHETFRIKPKTVKKEGWVNVTPTSNHDFRAVFGVYATKEEAETCAKHYGKKGTACIRIEWEEKQ